MANSICIIMGSKSDISISEKVTSILNELDIDNELHIASAHRTPELVKEIVNQSSAEIFIAIAGLSAALPGVIAAHTLKPVIGVPVSGKVNLDSILSIVQMPPGIPVAAVGLDNGKNAALMAAQILALNNPKLKLKLQNFRDTAKKNILKDNNTLTAK